MILQLNPTMPVETPRGLSECWALIWESPEREMLFLCIDDASGQFWIWDQQKVRGCKNITLRRENPERL